MLAEASSEPGESEAEALEVAAPAGAAAFELGREFGRGEPANHDGAPAAEVSMEYEPKMPVSSFVRVSRDVLLSPTTFFSTIASDEQNSEERVWPPVLFVVAASLVFVVLGGAYDIAALALRGELSTMSAFGVQGPASLAILAPVLVVAVPLAAAIGLYIGAFVLHLAVMIFAGSERRTYYSTLKVFAYTSVTALFAWIPVVWFVANVYGAYLTAVGVRQMHRSTPTRAAVIAILLFIWSGGSLFLDRGPAGMILAGGLG